MLFSYQIIEFSPCLWLSLPLSSQSQSICFICSFFSLCFSFLLFSWSFFVSFCVICFPLFDPMRSMSWQRWEPIRHKPNQTYSHSFLFSCSPFDSICFDAMRTNVRQTAQRKRISNVRSQPEPPTNVWGNKLDSSLGFSLFLCFMDYLFMTLWALSVWLRFVHLCLAHTQHTHTQYFLFRKCCRRGRGRDRTVVVFVVSVIYVITESTLVCMCVLERTTHSLETKINKLRAPSNTFTSSTHTVHTKSMACFFFLFSILMLPSISMSYSIYTPYAYSFNGIVCVLYVLLLSTTTAATTTVITICRRMEELKNNNSSANRRWWKKKE